MTESPRELSLRLHKAANLCPHCAGLLNSTAEYLRTIRVSVDEIQAEAAARMNSRGETPGFLRALSAYPDGFKRPTMRRYWVTEGLEPEADAIVKGIERWEAHWLANGYRVAMDKFLFNEMWKQEPPKEKHDHRTAKSEREYAEPTAADDLPIFRPKGTKPPAGSGVPGAASGNP